MSENTVKHEHKQCGGKNIEKMEEIGKTMPVEEEIYDVAELFKVLGDQTRVKILFTLIKDEMCVCDIAELLEMSQSAISHQLRGIRNEELGMGKADQSCAPTPSEASKRSRGTPLVRVKG